MAGAYNTFHVRLYRDGLQTAWGFRLLGGRDFNQPLTIQRVFTGSPAEGELQRGDIIHAIDNHDTSTLSHKDAMDIIKRSGGQLLLAVKRGGHGQSRVSQSHKASVTAQVPSHHYNQPQHQNPSDYCQPMGSFNDPQMAAYRDTVTQAKQPQHLNNHTSPPGGYASKPQYQATPGSFGHMFSAGGGGAPRSDPDMIHRVSDSLDNAIQGDEDENPFTTVRDRRSQFSGAPNEARMRPSFSTGKKWTPPSQTTSHTPEYGWVPGRSSNPHPIGYQPPSHGSEPDVVNRPRSGQFGGGPGGPPAHAHHAHSHSTGGAQGVVEEPTVPAWKGTLRNAAAPWYEEALVTGEGLVGGRRQFGHKQNVSSGGDSMGVKASLAENLCKTASTDDSQVVHLQYNTPMGLYSKDNISSAFGGQVQGQGKKSLVVSGEGSQRQYDWGRSHVFQLLQSEEQTGGKAHPQGGYNYPDPAHRALIKQGDTGNEDFGASDF